VQGCKYHLHVAGVELLINEFEKFYFARHSAPRLAARGMQR
jgi:hypothetical protein